MEVVWQLLEENGIEKTEVKGLKQRVAKKPVAEAASAAKKLEEAKKSKKKRGIREPALAAEDLGEPVPAVRDPKKKKKPESQEGPERIGKTREPASVAEDLGRRGEIRELALTATLLLFQSDC